MVIIKMIIKVVPFKNYSIRRRTAAAAAAIGVFVVAMAVSRV